MSGSVNGSTDELVVVHVRDAINSILAGRGDVSYQSPPLPHGEAMTLVRLLLGRGEEPAPAEDRWTCPIAGGQRTVKLEPAQGINSPPSRREPPRVSTGAGWPRPGCEVEENG